MKRIRIVKDVELTQYNVYCDRNGWTKGAEFSVGVDGTMSEQMAKDLVSRGTAEWID